MWWIKVRETERAELKVKARRVSAPLGLAVFLLPAVFVWFLMRAGYSTRSRIAACLWLGFCGLFLIATAPNGVIRARLLQPAAEAAAREGGPMLIATAASDALTYKLGEAHSVYRTLRVPVTVSNRTGARLAYAEVFCSFYDANGKLLGHGLANWKALAEGQTVSGEVVAAGVDLPAVGRQACEARPL